MARTIVYTDRVLRQIEEAADYLRENFSSQSANNLITKIADLEDRMLNYPESGRPTKAMANIRCLNVDKHRRLFYHYTHKQVKVLAYFDTRQDPAKSPF